MVVPLQLIKCGVAHRTVPSVVPLQLIKIYVVFDKMFVCELNLSWEWMHRWHPEYPAHVSEFEWFP